MADETDMAGLFGSFEPEITKGLLDYIHTQNQPTNPWDVAGKSLSSFSKNYMQALADPKTRGMAFGAGFAGVGDTLREELGPEKKLKGVMTTAGVLEQLAKYKNLGKEGTSEYERLLAAKGTSQYKTDPDYASHIDSRLKDLEGLSNSNKETQLQAMMRIKADPNASPEDRKYAEDWLQHQITFKPNNTNVNVNMPTQPVYDPETQSWITPNSKDTGNYLDKQINEGNDLLQQIQIARKAYLPETGSWGGKAREWGRVMKEKITGEVSPEQEAKIRAFSASDTAVQSFSSILTNKIFGAAVTGGELERAKLWLPQPGDSPSQIQGKLEMLEAIQGAAVQRLTIARNKGLSASDLRDKTRLATSVGPLENWLPSALKDKWSLPTSGDGGNPTSPVPSGGPEATGILPPGPSASGPPPAASSPPGGGLLPPATTGQPAPQAAPSSAPPPAPAPAQPPLPGGSPISVQGGKMVAPAPKSRGEANVIVSQAIKQGVDPRVIDQWLKDNGI